MKPIRCPKCSNTGAMQLIELWQGHTLAFDQRADGSLDPIGWTGDGVPYGVEGKCDRCAHRWRLRGVTQITDLPNYPREDK